MATFAGLVVLVVAGVALGYGALYLMASTSAATIFPSVSETWEGAQENPTIALLIALAPILLGVLGTIFGKDDEE